MKTFLFHGRNAAGVAINGKRFATNADMVAQALFQEGITPTKIEEQKNQGSSVKGLRAYLPVRLVPLTELLMFCRQMYTLQKSGVPILSGVTRLAESCRNLYLQQVLYDIVERLSAGEPFASCLRHHKKVFPPLFVNLVRVGESSGRLDTAFAQIGSYLELEEVTQKRIKSAVRYPIFVITTLLIALIIINFLVMPAFAKIFERFHEQLPLPTRILLGTSNFLIDNWVAILFLVMTSIGVWIYFIKGTGAGRMYWHRIQLRIPIIGSIIHRILLARFSRTFALVIRSGVPMVEGIQLVAAATGNDYVAHNISTMHQSIAQGQSLTQSAAATGMFSPLILQMLTVGEETGEVDTMLEEVAEFYEREVDYDLKHLSEMLEPILLVILGGMVLILALGVFLPVWNMISLIRK